MLVLSEPLTANCGGARDLDSVIRVLGSWLGASKT